MLEMSKNMTNPQIARLLRQVAAAFEVKDENFFRTKAYQNAAAAIEHTGSHLRDLWQEGKLGDIPGVGSALQQHLDELFTTGEVRHFQNETKDLPEGMFVLLGLPNIGPKTAYKLAKHFNLDDRNTAIAKLLAHAKNGEIRILPGFKDKTEQEIVISLESQTQKSKELPRMLFPQAEALSGEIIEYLKKCPDVMEIEVLGSQRRHAVTVGDVDLAVKTNNPGPVMDHVKAYPYIDRIVSSGEKTTMFVHSSGRQVDIKTQSPEKWGSMLQHYTGSKLHNIHLRKLAIDQGKSLSENGIKFDGKLHTFDNEQDFYKFLDLDFVPAPLREDTGEIELAQKHKIPSLVEQSDLLGDLHIHSNIDVKTSHDLGLSSVSELLSQAMEQKYQYIGISDHNPRQKDLSLKEKIDLMKKRNEIIDQEYYSFKKLNPKCSIKILKGLEVDIRPDGDLALEDELFEYLDYAIASIHSSFEQDQQTAHKRIIKAISHPKVNIIGHPTGRMLQKREGLDYDWPEVFAACKQHQVSLEINSSPQRMDLSENLIKAAIESGVSLVINSDSHNSEMLPFVKYGIYNAQRGYAKPEDILNCQPLSKLEKTLKKA
jgi:DNA polymerase (family 10)